MSNRIDLTGKRFGRLVVLEYKGNLKWLCKCDCGNEKVVTGQSLRRGTTLSCGCYCKDRHPKKHGNSKEKLYRRWKSIRSRCNDPKNISWKNYGGRGIKVCDEWNKDYTAFKDWAILHGYRQDLTIDRINNDGDYCPENCRFVKRDVQARNRRNNRFLTISGVTKVAKDWAKESCVGYDAILHRIKDGLEPEKIIFEPSLLERDKATGRYTRKAGW